MMADPPRTTAVLSAILLTAMTLSAASALADQADPFDGRVRLTLTDALSFKTLRTDRRVPFPATQDLQLDLTCRDGKWAGPVWGFTKYIPGQEHLGRVTSQQTGDDGSVTLTIAMEINPSRHRPCVLGGPGELTLTLTPDANAVTGTFTLKTTDTHRPAVIDRIEERWGMGREPGQKSWSQPTVRNRLHAYLKTATTRGKAIGTLRPHVTRVDGFTAPASGEHPRLLFGKSELAELRRRAKTPAGQKIIAELKDMLERARKYGYGYRYPQAEHTMGPMWAAGWGLLYQLTGEQQYAEIAAEQFGGPMYNSYYYGGWWIHPYALMGTAASYDLCKDAWTPEKRELVYAFLEKNVRDLAHRHDLDDLLGTSQRYHFANDQTDFEVHSVTHTKAAKFRAAAAMAALALVGDQPPVYQPPAMNEVRRIEPADGYDPSIGTPVVTLEDDTMFRRWLVNGPFPRGSQDEYIARLGGWETLRAKPGEAVEVDGETLEFRLYLPTNARSKTTPPSIYARNCARYWTSATGGGHWPGIRLARKWHKQTGRRPRINVVLYTVLRNERERVIQALPNWRSRSEGTRMWINGKRVRDGELVRLGEGLFPILVDVPVFGGYSAQAPKLREYTPRMHAADVARARHARHAYSGDDVFSNEMLRSATVLRRSVRRYLDEAVAPDGWGGWDTHETVLPMLLAVRNVLGQVPDPNDGLRKLMPIAARLRGHHATRACDTMVSQGAFLMSREDRRIARWYLDNHTLALRRPMDAAVALATHPLEAEAIHPSRKYPAARFHPSGQALTCIGNWSGEQAPFAMVQAGSTGVDESIYQAGHLQIQAFGRRWARTRHGGWDPGDYGQMNNISVRNMLPVAPARVTHLRTREDGSATITMTLDKLREIVGRTHRGRPILAKTDPNIALQRSVLVDTISGSGALTVITADRISGAGKREKVWRMDLDRVYTTTAYNRRRPTLTVNKRTVLVTPKKVDGTMAITFAGPAGLNLHTRSAIGKHQKGTILEAKLHRHVSKIEKLKKNQLDAGREEIIRSGGDVTPGDDPAPDSGPPSLDSDNGELIEDMEDDLHRKRMQREAKLPPVTILSVITLQKADPPKVTISADGETRTITVGKTTYHYDGKTLQRGK